jgi:hypothetical protein
MLILSFLSETYNKPPKHGASEAAPGKTQENWLQSFTLSKDGIQKISHNHY